MRKRYGLFSLALILAAPLGAQTAAPAAAKEAAKDTPAASASERGRKLQETLRKATQDFMTNPESAKAENAFVEAQKAVFSYQKEQAEAREKALSRRSPAQKQADERLHKAEKQLSETKKAFQREPDSPAARKAFVAAQKEVFAARKALRPLILIDGRECTDPGAIDKKDIKTVSVLKNPEDLAPYGDKGRNGVIRITTHGKMPSQASMQQLRLRYLSRAIELKDNQREAFEKAYNAYAEQSETLRRENRTLSEKTDWQTALDKILKNNIAIEQKRYEMFKSLRNVLSDQQLSRLYRADLRFARDIMSKSSASAHPAARPSEQAPKGGGAKK